MGRKSKTKIVTNQEKETFLSVANPFAEISLDNLPDGPGLRPEEASAAVEASKSRGRVDVTREKSGRAGKTVTVLSGFSETISPEELNALALKLKRQCACGGSLKEQTIELQGDVCSQVMVELETLGFKPVRCGG